MKLYNIKARFIHDNSLNDNILEHFSLKNIRYILREVGATFTVYNHNKFCTHVTGVKSKNHLKQCQVYIKEAFNIGITQVIIDNQFYSHKDNRVLDMIDATHARVSEQVWYVTKERRNFDFKTHLCNV